jgi:hypothetical protein
VCPANVFPERVLIFMKGRNPVNQLPALRRTLLLLPVLALSMVQVDAQSPQTASPDELFRTIAALDGALFDAYNRCAVEKFVTFLADDLEFYHDQGGLTRGQPDSGRANKEKHLRKGAP